VLRERIQTLADNAGLGIEVLNVNLLGVHPPVKEVAPMFEEIYIAREKAHTAVLNANTYLAQQVPLAESHATALRGGATAYSYRVKALAEAESRRFESQLSAYRAMPEMFKLRSYLEILEQDCRNIRKFVVPSSMEREVYEMNFEVSPQLRLLDSGIQDITRE